MKSALLFLALVALSEAGVSMQRDLAGRIVNGTDAEFGEIPFQVSIQYRYDSFHFCGGSVLNEYYVLTAAHCVDGERASRIKVIAGSVNLDDPKSVHLPEKIIMHKEYVSEGVMVNDIALIKVKEPFVRSKTLDYVPLPEKGQLVPTKSVAVTSGWGRLWQGGDSPKKLQRADILIATNEYCAQIYSTKGYSVYGSHVCAYDPNYNTGACHGDSGGPLTVEGKIVGIASAAYECGSTKFPVVYTRVPDFIDWINEHAV